MSLTPKRVKFNEKWDELKVTLENLITVKKVSKKLWRDHFSDVYALCVAHPQSFADRLYCETKRFLTYHVLLLLTEVTGSSGVEMVTVYYSMWTKYSVGLGHLNCLFLYLNLHYAQVQFDLCVETIHDDELKFGRECMVIEELGLALWKQLVITPLKDILVDLLLDGIINFKMSSADNISSRCVYQGSIESFVSVEDYKREGKLQFYEEIFEEPYLKRCGKLYELECVRLLQEGDVSNYLKNVLLLFEEERKRCTMFLHSSSLPKLEAQFVKYTAVAHLDFLNEECHEMVQQEQFSNLKMMYLLLRLVDNGISHLSFELLEHIKLEGIKVVSALTAGNSFIQFVESILDLYEKYSWVISNYFENDQRLLNTLDKACFFVINKRKIPENICDSPDRLAKYCDKLLKKSCKSLTEAELEYKLGKSIIILRYIEDKDVFEKCYSRLLAKRLIFKLSQSLDAEEVMINKLKHAYGYEFTSKLRRMLTDIKLCSDLNCKFSNYLKKENVNLGVSYFFHVLQAASWPLSQSTVTAVSLPLQLETTVQLFNTFYHNNFNSRKLTFLHHYCQVEVKLCYLKKYYIITMQMFQLMILLQFEKSDRLSYVDLQETTQMTDEHFVKVMKSLIDSKLIICTDQTPIKSSLFYLNCAYVNKRTKFRLTAVSRDSVEEAKQTHFSIEEDRKLYLHAAIVRIMKNHKVLNHKRLIQEIQSLCQAKFTPDVTVMKKAIESLIEKQYIERTSNSADEYSYKA